MAEKAEKIAKTEEEWRKQLTPEQYHVTREAGTEPAFSGKYWKTKDAGVYHCVCCGEPLFSSETKFDSGTGWPSFWAPLDKQNVEEHTDRSYGMTRVEARCSHCGAHLGHVFPDGPRPTGSALLHELGFAGIEAGKGSQVEEAGRDLIARFRKGRERAGHPVRDDKNLTGKTKGHALLRALLL